MKFNLSVILLTLLVFSNGQTGLIDNNFEIKINIKGKPLDEHYLYSKYYDGDFNSKIDSLRVDSEGELDEAIHGFVESPIILYLSKRRDFNTRNGSDLVYFYIEPGNMKLTLNFDNYSDYNLEGSVVNDDYLSLNEQKKELIQSRLELGRFLKKLYTKVQRDSTLITTMNRVDSIYTLLSIVDMDTNLDFVKKNLNSYYSLILLDKSFGSGDGRRNRFNEIFNLYTLLGSELKKSPLGIELGQTLNAFKETGIGKLAPDFEAKDINGDLIRLSNYRESKYILLDFWASWCAPCVKDFPNLKELYSTYKGDLEIISISTLLDRSVENWKSAVKKYNVYDWTHVSSLQNKELKSYDNIDELYSIQMIPVKILIDKKGKVIGRWIGGGDENMNKLKNILETKLHISSKRETSNKKNTIL